MDEKTLISQLKLLKQIKPGQDWVVLTKNRILREGADSSPAFWKKVTDGVFPRIPGYLWRALIFGEKLALGRAGVVTFVIILAAGLFGFVGVSTPGDTLYSVRKAILRGEAALLSEGPATVHLKVAAHSSQALKEAVRTNNPQKLAVALQEYKENIKRAAETIDKQPKDVQEILKIATLVNQIQSDAKELEGKLQTDLAKEERKALAQKTLEESTDALKTLLEKELNSIAGNTLSEEQARLLDEARAALERGDYTKVMEDILKLSNY